MEERILIYDINSIPESIDLEDIIHAFRESKIVLYDAMKGQPPVIIGKDIVDIVLQDMSGQLSLLSDPLFNPEDN